MKLKEILTDFDLCCKVVGEKDIEICGLQIDSRLVKPKDAFFCLTGTSVDGHDFASDAVKNGASVVFCEKKLDIDCLQIVCTNTRKALSVACCNFYGNPSKDMIMVGITGTNGKTTSSYILAEIFKSAGKKVGIVGTNGVFFDGKSVESNMTTPDPIFLQKTLKDMVYCGVDVCIMEVSAHALALDKLCGIVFDCVIFTNLTQDHLDFFGTMENYGNAKLKIFSKKQCRRCVVNVDDEFGEKIAQKSEIPVSKFSIKTVSDVYVASTCKKHLKQCFNACVFGNNLTSETNLLGDYNLSNVIGCVACAAVLGVANEHIVDGVKNAKTVPGRFNIVDMNKHGIAVVDFAHTPDGIEKILNELRNLCKSKLICVFGAGGNRDKSKRPIMGHVADKFADKIVITSDNPRYENPDDIIEEIYAGVENKFKVTKIFDRKTAIEYAVKNAKTNDYIAILGKGAEDYIDVCGEKIPYSDYEILNNIKKMEDYE